MNRSLVCLVLLGAIGATAAPADALAQTAPSADKKRVAKQYVDAGLAAQRAGEYDAAITFYSRAYELVQHPALIFNLAQAHRLAGRIEQALTLYKRYLSEAPTGPEAETARELIGEIEARKAEAARKADAARTADEARIAAVARVPDEARTAQPAQPPRPQVGDRALGGTTADPAATLARATASPELTPPGRTQRIAGLATGAGGVAALAIGIGFGLHARSLADELSRDGAVYEPAKVHAGERANTIAIVGLAGGSALIAVGAAIYWQGYAQGRSAERVSLAPVLSQHAAGLVLSGALP